MGLLDRIRLWRQRRKHIRITLGAVPLPTLIPDAEAGLAVIYSMHTKKGYKLFRFWEVLVLRADANTPHQSVVRAMDAASQLGLTRLSIATIESK